MLKYAIILSIILNSSSSFCNDVVFIKAGQVAPNDGYLFSPDKAQDVKAKLLDLEDLKSINTSYQHSIDLYKKNQDLYTQQLSMVVDENTKLINAQQQSVNLTTWEKIGYFALGVVVTGGAVWSAEKILINSK